MRDPSTRHDQLAVESKCVCEAADCLGDESAHAMRSQIDRAYEFLAQRFLPNAREEHRPRQRDETIREARRILYEVAGLLQAHYGGAAT